MSLNQRMSTIGIYILKLYETQRKYPTREEIGKSSV